MGSFLAGSSCGVKGRALPDGGRVATLPEAPPSQVRPGRGARFRTTVLCPGRAARPLLSGRKAGKLIGTRAEAVTDCQAAAKEQPRKDALGRVARAVSRSRQTAVPVPRQDIRSGVRLGSVRYRPWPWPPVFGGVAVDVGICEAFAVPWTALRMDAFVPLCPLYHGAVEERYVILEYLHPGLLPSGHRRAFAQGSGHGRFGSGRPAGAVAFSAPAALGPSAFSGRDRRDRRSGRHPGRDPAGAHRPRGSGHRRARGRLDRPAAPGRGPVVVARSGLGLCPVPPVRHLEALARARLGKLAARRLGHHAGRYPGRSYGHVLHAGAAGPGLGLARGERTSSHAAADARGCLRRDGYRFGGTAFSGRAARKKAPSLCAFLSLRAFDAGG